MNKGENAAKILAEIMTDVNDAAAKAQRAKAERKAREAKGHAEMSKHYLQRSRYQKRRNVFTLDKDWKARLIVMTLGAALVWYAYESAMIMQVFLWGALCGSFRNTGG